MNWGQQRGKPIIRIVLLYPFLSLMESTGMISAFILSMPKVHIHVVYLNGDSFTRRAIFPKKRQRKQPITVSLIPHLRMLGGSLQLIGSGSRSLVGMIQDFGFGEEKILSCLSKYGCVEAEASGCLALVFLMFIVVTHAPRVDQELLLTSSMVFLPLLEITNELLKYGSMMSTKSSSTLVNPWQDLLTWEIYQTS